MVLIVIIRHFATFHFHRSIGLAGKFSGGVPNERIHSLIPPKIIIIMHNQKATPPWPPPLLPLPLRRLPAMPTPECPSIMRRKLESSARCVVFLEKAYAVALWGMFFASLLGLRSASNFWLWDVMVEIPVGVRCIWTGPRPPNLGGEYIFACSLPGRRARCRGIFQPHDKTDTCCSFIYLFDLPIFASCDCL